jgi:hypothetical protein
VSEEEPAPHEDGPREDGHDDDGQHEHGAGSAAPTEELEADDKRPPFARTFPRVAAIETLLNAYVAGDFAYVREHAPLVAADNSEDEAVVAAARDLRRRIEPHPTATILWGLGVALLVMLFGYYLMASHNH